MEKGSRELAVVIEIMEIISTMTDLYKTHQILFLILCISLYAKLPEKKKSINSDR